MKIVKKGMRIWITVASLFSFLAGWVFFAHSNKPAPLQVIQPVQSAPAANPAFQAFGSNSQTNRVTNFFQNQTNNFRPMLRTGGS